MELATLLILVRSICVGLAASITVGPVAVLCIQRTLSKSRISGIVSGFGVACADTFMAIIAFSCYSMLAAKIQEHHNLLTVIGGAFVVMVGVYVFLQNPAVQIRKNRAGRTNLWQDFASIFGLTISNFIMVIPYLLAFFSVFDISAVEAREAHDLSGLFRSFIVICGFFIGSLSWWTMLALLLGLFRRRFRPRHMLTINHIAGIVIGLLGIYTILSTFINILPNGIH